jgi:hypothetical protein
LKKGKKERTQDLGQGSIECVLEKNQKQITILPCRAEYSYVYLATSYYVWLLFAGHDISQSYIGVSWVTSCLSRLTRRPDVATHGQKAMTMAAVTAHITQPYPFHKQKHVALSNQRPVLSFGII